MNLQDKVIIVTGGTSGIGEACSRHFSELGAKVAIASNQPQAGAALADELAAAGRQVRFIETDVSVEEDVEKLVDETLDAFGRIDCLHSNAGVWLEGTVKDFTEDDWQTMMGVNVKGNFLLLKHIVPVMEEQGKGVVLITTSVAAFVGFPAHALYCASKAALEALIRCPWLLTMRVSYAWSGSARGPLTLRCCAPVAPGGIHRLMSCSRKWPRRFRCGVWASPRTWPRWLRFHSATTLAISTAAR